MTTNAQYARMRLYRACPGVRSACTSVSRILSADRSVLRQGHWATLPGCGQIWLMARFKRADKFQDSAYRDFPLENLLDRLPRSRHLVRLIAGREFTGTLEERSSTSTMHPMLTCDSVNTSPIGFDARLFNLTPLHFDSLHFIWACDFTLAAAKR